MSVKVHDEAKAVLKGTIEVHLKKINDLTSQRQELERQMAMIDTQISRVQARCSLLQRSIDKLHEVEAN